MRLYLFISFVFILFSFTIVNAQTLTEGNSVKVSGIIVKHDSITPIPFVNIINKRTNTGTISDINGFFSISILKSDTILFSSLSFEKKPFHLTDTLGLVSYFFKIIMNDKNYKLAVINVYALSKQSQFRYDFIHLDLPEHLNLSGKEIYIPGIPHYDGPHDLNKPLIGSPISFFYTKFSKIEKSKRKLKQLLKQDAINKIINSKYNKKIVGELTGLKDERLNVFMKFCDFNNQYLLKNKEYDIYVRIMQNFKKFNSKTTPREKQ